MRQFAHSFIKAVIASSPVHVSLASLIEADGLYASALFLQRCFTAGRRKRGGGGRGTGHTRLIYYLIHKDQSFSPPFSPALPTFHLIFFQLVSVNRE